MASHAATVEFASLTRSLLSTQSLHDRITQLNEWKRVHVNEFEELQGDVKQLQIAVLRNPVVTETRINEIEKRLMNIELWEANMSGRLWMLGCSLGFVQFLTMIILHFWK